ncbi:MAG: rhodanese-like domain-containing protein [Proteobacteria bacterium]|nr:rhodanese-like domain-containing protein [Pseudomonadota bacterium]
MTRDRCPSRELQAAGCSLPGRLMPLLSLFIVFFACRAYGLGVQDITAPEVKNMMENDPRVVVINALSKIEYDGLHITGSINIPVINFRTTELLPADKTTPLILYCMGQD